MQLPRRRFLQLGAGAAALPALSRLSRADSYPARPVRLIVTVPAGGSPDIIGRLMAQWLSERLGQPFVIENRPGASANIGTEVVVKAPPDGYTLLLAMSANAINASTYQHMNFNFMRDTAPVASIATIPLVMVENLAVPAVTVPEFIAYAKANPGKINMATAGNGTPLHVAGELFKMMAGVDMVDVPYQGEALALPDLISGQGSRFSIFNSRIRRGTRSRSRSAPAAGPVFGVGGSRLGPLSAVARLSGAAPFGARSARAAGRLLRRHRVSARVRACRASWFRRPSVVTQ